MGRARRLDVRRGPPVIFFRVFGPLYCLDGLLGLATGSGYLDLGIVMHGVLDLPLITRILMNLPHIAIGGFAAFAGYVLARLWAPAAADRRADMLRWAMRIVGGLLLLALIGLGADPLDREVLRDLRRDARCRRPAPLVDDRGLRAA